LLAHSLRLLVNALEEFRPLGIEFVSLHEGVDTSTPNGAFVFGIFISIAEFERVPNSRTGMVGPGRGAGAEQAPGAAAFALDAEKAAELRAQGASSREIARELGVGVGTVQRRAQAHSKSQSLAAPISG
jgi:DNA invertase Pin-like site-specific DNA recombinase